MDIAANDLTEIAVILDRSGSMARIKDDMEGGLWTLIREQHGAPGRCRVSLYQFDDIWEPVFEGRLSGEIKPEDCRLSPRGGTALHDAVVKSLSTIESRILAEPEEARPERVVILVITDGQENASQENNNEDSQTIIKRVTEKFGWKFVFLAADAEGFADGARMTRGAIGARLGMYDVKKSKRMYNSVSRALFTYRSGNSDDVEIEDPSKEQTSDSSASE